MNLHIEQALQNFRDNAARYARAERYYRGSHDLAFASVKFQNTFGAMFREFALNLCPAVCDAVRDKLIVRGFGVEEAGSEMDWPRENHNVPPTTPSTKNAATPPQAGRELEGSLGREAQRIWDRNRMGTRAGELHKEVLKNGDAYAIVWPDANGEPVIYPNRAGTCTVVYDEEAPGRILWAAKYWRTPDKRTRLNLMYTDRIEKYISVRESERALPEAGDFVTYSGEESPTTPASTTPSAPRGRPSPGRRGVSSQIRNPQSEIPNPYGIVPVFHFANNADIGSLGRSELEGAIPIQDGLNKSVLDMLVAMEYSAYRQRWVAGIELQVDDATGQPIAPFKAGIDHLWVSQNPEATFGDFGTADLEQFLKVKDSFRTDICSVTGTPLHYLMPFAGGFPSGEAFRKAEARFIAKVHARQVAFGQVWASLMSFALNVAGYGSGVRLITDWEDPSPLSERELLENIRIKRELGIPIEQALAEAGYGTAEIEKMRAKEDQPAKHAKYTKRGI